MRIGKNVDPDRSQGGDTMDRRHFIGGTAAAAAALAVGPARAADNYPAHPITLINPFPPGGAADVVGRPFAAALEPVIKQAVVIETKAGAAGAVGAQVAANAKPDGYTLLLHITSISGFAEVDKLFGRKTKFTRADFIPIARFVADPCVLLVNDKQPYKTLAELTADARKRPDEIIFSSSGLYGALHIPMALYMKSAGGLKFRHLPTNGGGPALTAFLGNNSNVLVSSISAALTQLKAGKARPLAMFGATRSKALPEVPTMKEIGYNVEYYLWVGLFAPKGTPADVVSYLRANAGKAAHTDLFKNAIANLGQELDYQDQPEFAKFWDADAARIEGAVKEIGRVQG
jgi:tripartite-type tricarboxylate transporter receptor subunit TctC